jgi:hypothetical protein
MGLLFTTEGTRRIRNTLNTAFDGPSPDPNKPIGLELIRSYVKSNSTLGTLVAGRNWAAGQLAGMLDLLPYDQGDQFEEKPLPPPAAGKISKSDIKRWNILLTKTIGPSAYFKPLQNALAGAILNEDDNHNQLNYQIVRVSFDHVELPAPDVNNPPNPSLVIFDAPLPGAAGGGTVRHITLFTAAVKPGTAGANNFPSPVISAPWKTSDPPP